mgnify:CR=1 FL=1
MANQVSFTIRLDDQGTFKRVTMSAEELGKAVRSVQDESEKAKRNIISWAEASQAASVLQDAIGELHGTISDLTDAWKVQIVAETQLQTVMRQRMGATDEEIQSIKNLCSAQQELGVIGDEVQLSGAQQMATFLQNKQSLDVLIPAMNNLVAQQNGLNATNQDAVSIGNMMGKAMQGQVEVLQRVGVTFDETQKKVLQYGTESERAAMLAKVITQNVGNMNAELAKTESGKQKQLENALGDIKEQLGEMVEGLEPAITYLAQFSMAATGVGKLVSSFIACSNALRITSVAGTLWNATSVRMNALVAACSATMRGAAVSATTLRLAIQGLMIATGVGVAVAALTTAIGYLMSSSDEAAESENRLSEAEQRAQQVHQQEAQQMASVRSELDMNIASLKGFKGSKEQEKKLVQQMNTKYGEAMGYYSSVSQWYQALTVNSKAYCDQMINEIRLRQLANQAADLMQKQKSIRYNEDGSLRKYSKKNKTVTKTTGQVDAGDGKIIPVKQEVEVKGTSDLDKANKQLSALYRQEQNVRKEMDAIVASSNKINFKHTAGYSPTAPVLGGGSGGGKTGHTPVPAHTTTTDEKEDPLKGSIDWYEKEISDREKALKEVANAETAKVLNAQMEGLQRELYMLKVKVGIERIPKIEVQQEVSKPISEQIKEDIEKLKMKPIHVETEVDAKAKDNEALSSLFNIDVTNFDSVRKAMADIKSISDPTAKGLAGAGTACQALGSAMQQLGTDSAAAKAGMVMAAVGQIVLSFAQALRTCSTWVDWLAFGITGTAQMVSLIGTISKFATGGIVGGNQTSGDNVLVRVNSGEMILNAAQQTRLFALANGAAAQGASVNTGTLQGVAAGGVVGGGQLVGKLRGRDIVIAIANETRSNRRRSNIRI